MLKTKKIIGGSCRWQLFLNAWQSTGLAIRKFYDNK